MAWREAGKPIPGIGNGNIPGIPIGSEVGIELAEGLAYGWKRAEEAEEGVLGLLLFEEVTGEGMGEDVDTAVWQEAVV